MRIPAAIAVCAPVAAIAVIGSLCSAQPARRARRGASAPPTGQNKRTEPLQFGDIQLTGYRKVSFVLGADATAEGPGTTVTATDAATGSRSQLSAPMIHAFIDEKSGGQRVKRVEATGGVRYQGERPMKGREGLQTVRFSGSKGTYYKSEGRVTLEGPVSYDAEQPASEGGKEWVKGTANQGSYSEEKKVMRLEGEVHASVMAPSLGDKPMPIHAEWVEVDMSASPYKFQLGPGIITVTPKPPAKPDTKGAGKKK